MDVRCFVNGGTDKLPEIRGEEFDEFGTVKLARKSHKCPILRTEK